MSLKYKTVKEDKIMKMKSIYELFPSLSKEQIDDCLKEQGVEVSEKNQFSSTLNIVIGPNGSGKTRFLKALKKLYSTTDNVNVIYGYFPSLSDKKVPVDPNRKPSITLYESITSNIVDFEDFFDEIEKSNTQFFEELLQQESRLRVSVRDIVSTCFFALTEKKLVFPGNKEAFVEEKGKRIPLSTMLERLSPGELFLFYISIFLSLRKSHGKNDVIILDEPESHLHPKALRQFIKLLCEQYNLASMWIATHSLFLIPSFEFDNIVYMQDSKVSPRRSSTYSSIINDVLGADKQVQLFFSSLSQWQYCEYIVECFTNPTIIKKINPQDEQIQLVLKKIIEKRPLHLLDWGGGSGRLGESLIAAGFEYGKDFYYSIYDINPQYTGDIFPVYRNIEDIDGKYDFVIMMNFLHEIEPKYWPSAFSDASKFLSDNGFLYFIEANVLNKGEMPNSYGYFLLNYKALQRLFPQISIFEVTVQKKSIGALIKKCGLCSVTPERVNGTLKYIKESSLRQIKEIRSSPKLFNETNDINELRELPAPRNYAFLLQQYVNALLYTEIDEKNLQKSKDENLRNAFNQAIKKARQQVKLESENRIEELEHQNKVLQIELYFRDIRRLYRNDSKYITDALKILEDAISLYSEGTPLSDELKRKCLESEKEMALRKRHSRIYKNYSEIIKLMNISPNE